MSNLVKALLLVVLSIVILTDTCKASFSNTTASVHIEVCENDADGKSNELETETEIEDTYFSNFNLVFLQASPKAILYHQYFSLRVQNISENIVSPPPEA